ncbi:unnamed protein product, partial [Allacma fusca]
MLVKRKNKRLHLFDQYVVIFLCGSNNKNRNCKIFAGWEAIFNCLFFVAEDWGPCSETCGEGVRRRKVVCKIFLEFSRTIASLPDKECPGPKPPEQESCFSQPCARPIDREGDDLENLSDSHHAALADSDAVSLTSNYRKTISVGLPPGISHQDMTFSWKLIGYSPCSSSCLGGVQDAIIHCVRDYDQRIATPVLCEDRAQPDIATTKTCNDHACPPRWNVSDFGPCSKPCGSGVMTREASFSNIEIIA